jgi:hypothetical protein
MRKIKFVLDYKGAKELEYARMRRAEDRHARNVERARQRRLAKSKEDLDLIDPDEFPSEEEIEVSFIYFMTSLSFTSLRYSILHLPLYIL